MKSAKVLNVALLLALAAMLAPAAGAQTIKMTVDASKTGPPISPLVYGCFLAVEPYIPIDAQPGAEFTWKDTLEYYTLPRGE